MTDTNPALPPLRRFSTAEELTEGDLKVVKQRLDTVGIEPSRLLAEWMKKTMSLELVLRGEDGGPVSVEEAGEQGQVKRKEIIDAIVDRIRKELGPISGVDPINAGAL